MKIFKVKNIDQNVEHLFWLLVSSIFITGVMKMGKKLKYARFFSVKKNSASFPWKMMFKCDPELPEESDVSLFIQETIRHNNLINDT